MARKIARDWKTHQLRAQLRVQVVRQAQRLARSGGHADHSTIIPLLQHMEGFEAMRERLEGWAIRAQLDRLCAMACANPRASTERP